MLCIVNRMKTSDVNRFINMCIHIAIYIYCILSFIYLYVCMYIYIFEDIYIIVKLVYVDMHVQENWTMYKRYFMHTFF